MLDYSMFRKGHVALDRREKWEAFFTNEKSRTGEEQWGLLNSEVEKKKSSRETQTVQGWGSSGRGGKWWWGKSHTMDVHAAVAGDGGGGREIVMYVLWGEYWCKVERGKVRGGEDSNLCSRSGRNGHDGVEVGREGDHKQAGWKRQGSRWAAKDMNSP
ncbi:hypothetical protein Cgig2_013516 [Carnegiea gigantea]|uniref:Uncharacterized protein n=1 Tax=Carnegiea gigantea TaxID=171969 RepID=A0A9Q1GRV2_9CARY|nr:hypothetical protein Cgig2_013516 [Carnegiea gigantea]